MEFKAFLIKYAEIGIKGNNRRFFEDALVRQMKYALKPVGEFAIRKESGRIFVHALEEYDIYISTKTACSKDNSDSLTLTTLGKDSSISGHSIRISISYLTTKEEIDTFLKALDESLKNVKKQR